MPNAEGYADIELFITQLSPAWEERMGIAHWEVKHVFVDEQYTVEPINDDFLITAVTEARWNYAMAKIKWYLPSAIRLSAEELEEVLVHELCHVVLSPEQALLEIKFEAVVGEVDHDDHSRYAAMFFERQELATELMARSLLRAWRQ